MESLKGKRNKLALIMEIISKETTGLENIGRKITFTMPEIISIRKALLSKSKEMTGRDREFYYKACIRINVDNYKEYFKLIDANINIRSRSINNKTNKTYEPEENNSFGARQSEEILITPAELPKFAKERLRRYIYLYSSDTDKVDVYLRDRDEYENSIAELNSIKEFLARSKINFKIHTICNSEIVENMDKFEKYEFIEFFKNY